MLHRLLVGVLPRDVGVHVEEVAVFLADTTSFAQPDDLSFEAFSSFRTLASTFPYARWPRRSRGRPPSPVLFTRSPASQFLAARLATSRGTRLPKPGMRPGSSRGPPRECPRPSAAGADGLGVLLLLGT